jgi:putative nucleotidyltransferase with HDIG domain
MTNRAFNIYAWILLGVALVSQTLLDWSELGTLEAIDWGGLGALVLFGLIAEFLALRIPIGKSGSTASSITFILIFASVLLFGPAATTLFAASSWTISQFVLLRKPIHKAVFNVSQIAFSATLAGWAFTFFGGVADSSTLDGFVFQSFVAFGATFIVVNQLLVAGGLRCLGALPFREALSSLAGPKASHMVYDFLVSPVALLVSVLFMEFEIWGLLGVALTLFFVRRSYLTSYQLQQALNDLLKVLVKAIETRDPYTSGHSMRVSALAKRISAEMGLVGRKAEEIETAALLHDIGKIDEIYNDILKKPNQLSPKEREIIESHSAKGAELLASLTSVSDDIIASVRHHHERVDGKGYPDRISGTQIPMGARIIKVCDAIDAMLSDRPYRKALRLSDVREQLVTYAGVQFDVEVVSVCVRGTLLEDHATELSLRKLQGAEPKLEVGIDEGGRKTQKTVSRAAAG